MSTRRFTLWAALAANVAIAITKLIVAAVSSSSAIFAEGLHSVVDTGDSLLILLALRLSRRPATPRHPYGHGREIYFWTMMVAMSIFGMGGVVSIYGGIRHLGERELPQVLIVGGVLGRETRSLLLGEAASSDTVESIQRIATSIPGVVAAGTPRTVHLGPDHVHVDLDVTLDPDGNLLDIARRIEAEVRDKHPQIRAVSLRFPVGAPG